MKIGIFLFIAAFAFIGLMKLTGCKTRPNVDNVNRAFYYGGSTVALVMNETSLNKEKRVVIRDIVVDIKACNPEVGQTLEAKWTEIAQEHVDLLIQAGKIDRATGVVIMAGFHTVMSGVSLLEQRFPEIQQDRYLISAAIVGFTDGFLNWFIVDPDANAEMDGTKNAPAAFCTIDIAVAETVRKAAVQNNLK